MLILKECSGARIRFVMYYYIIYYVLLYTILKIEPKGNSLYSQGIKAAFRHSSPFASKMKYYSQKGKNTKAPTFHYLQHFVDPYIKSNPISLQSTPKVLYRQQRQQAQHRRPSTLQPSESKHAYRENRSAANQDKEQSRAYGPMSARRMSCHGNPSHWGLCDFCFRSMAEQAFIDDHNRRAWQCDEYGIHTCFGDFKLSYNFQFRRYEHCEPSLGTANHSESVGWLKEREQNCNASAPDHHSQGQ